MAMQELLLDVEMLDEIAEIGSEGLSELVDLYLSQADEILVALRTAVQTGAINDVAYLAHKLAGSSAACGATAMVQSLRALEQRAKQGELSESDLNLVEIGELLELSRRSMIEYRNKKNA